MAAPRKRPAPYSKATAKVSISEEQAYNGSMMGFLRGVQTIAAKFPFQFYKIIDDLAMVDPYISKYIFTTIALGNTGHKLEIDAPSEARAQEAIQAASDFAARCFPWGGGMDGVGNALFSQVARAGGLCVEWAPDAYLSQVQEAFIVPIKMLRFRHTADGELELCQLQATTVGGGIAPMGMLPLNMMQTSYHISMPNDSNPYPIPPTIAALESCMAHRKINHKIADWMEKVSALGVLMAEVEPPPKEPNESQATYDAKCQVYLDKIADSIGQNMSHGIGVGFNNIKFNFANTQASAQGAKDILQIVLQGLFGALQRDPIFFGWNFNTTESFARVVYEEMTQGLCLFRAGVQRALEHGHRLNFALGGFGDIGVGVHFNASRSIDAFRDSEAEYMDAQSAIAQVEAGIIDIPMARTLLGHEEIKAGAGEFVASFSRETGRYILQTREKAVWTGAEISTKTDLAAPSRDFETSRDYRSTLRQELSWSFRGGVEAFWAWMLTCGQPTEDTFVKEGMTRLIDVTEGNISGRGISGAAMTELRTAWENAKIDPKLYPDYAERSGTISKNLSPDELVALVFFATKVEPHYVKNFLSQSPQRQRSIESFLRSQYGRIDWNTHDGLNLFKAQLLGLSTRLANNAGNKIADAAVSRAITWSQVYSLSAHNITEFVIDGPRDSLKCDFCWAMLDRVFSVQIEKANMQGIVNTGNTDIIQVASPVAARYREDLDALRSATDSEIQETGLAAPPYHNECRDYIMARTSTGA